MRRSILLLVCGLAFAAMASGETASTPAGSPKVTTKDIFNYRRVDDQFITGGQPKEEELKAVADEGYQVVINLATDDPRYSLKDEAASVTGLGMRYYHIPVIWDAPTDADFATFEKVMQNLNGARTLVHCAANYRATAFYTLYAEKHLGWTKERGREFRDSIWGGTKKFPEWTALIERTEAQIP